MAEALYNKYRPQIFEDVVGQEHIERTLKNAIASDKISHAYMFTGPRGTGKTTTARLLAKALLCESGPTPDPDGSCEDCRLVASGEHPDVYELDAASRTGVENVREEIIGKVNYAPTRGRYKVYIIDEVHMLSTAAFNALLKTLEEPPSHVVFVLCTTDPQKVPETIQSRCQRFDFRRISSEELISRLGAICELEGVRFEGDALDLIAHRANGGMRDALTSLDQLIAFGEGEVTTELAERLLGSLDSSDLADIVKAIGQRDAAACFRWTSEYMETGADLVQFVQDLTSHMRDMYVMSLAGADVALEVTEAGRRELEVELAWYGSDRLARMLAVLGDLTMELKTSTNQRLSFEIALTRMVRPESDLTMASLAERVEEVERALANGVPAQRQRAVVATESAPAPSRVSEEGIGLSQDEAVLGGTSTAAIAAGSDASVADAASDSQPAAASASAPASDPAKARGLTPFSGRIPADATQLWNSTLAHLKKIGPAYGVVFMNTVASVDDGRLTIAFSPDSEFAFKASQKQDAREALEKALARAGVEGIPYRIVRSESAIPQQNDPFASGASFQQPSEPPVQPQETRSQSVPVEVATSADSGHLPEPEAISEPTPWAERPTEPQPVEAMEPQPVDPQLAEPQPAPAQSQPESSDGEDSDFADFITAAFGENVIIEEIQE